MLSRTFECFDTTNTISVASEDASLLLLAEEKCRYFEKLFSRFHPTSELYLLNNAQGKSVQVTSELLDLLETSLFYARETGGLFNPAIGALCELWNFHQATYPAASDIESALSHSYDHNLLIEGNSARLLDSKVLVDLGGIAKGYVADSLIQLLRSRGCNKMLVNLGGNVAVFGGKPDGTPWNVGIRNPLPSCDKRGQDAFAAISLVTGSVVTSGIYERVFMHEGTICHHILDPNTGYPAHTDLLSATIVSEKSIDGDGYSTALIIMGLEQAFDFIAARKGLEAIFVTSDNKVVTTPGIKDNYNFIIL